MLLLKKYSVNPLLKKISTRRIINLTAVNNSVSIFWQTFPQKQSPGKQCEKNPGIPIQSLVYPKTESIKILQ